MKEITAEELHHKIENGEKINLVDVREIYEHEDYNIGGVNIPLAELPQHLDQLKELGNEDFVLYCRSGNRSGTAQKLLAIQYNIQNTINLKGGILAWKAAVDD